MMVWCRLKHEASLKRDDKVYLDGYTIFDINFIEGIYSAISIEGILEEIKDIKITSFRIQKH